MCVGGDGSFVKVFRCSERDEAATGNACNSDATEKPTGKYDLWANRF